MNGEAGEAREAGPGCRPRPQAERWEKPVKHFLALIERKCRASNYGIRGSAARKRLRGAPASPERESGVLRS
jgi:hypothetical protein